MNLSLPPIAVLLGEARGAYGAAIHREMAQRGLDPLPPSGAFVLGALHHELTREDIVRQRGRILEQGQTLARLASSGYVIDEPDGLRLTDAGHDCAHVVGDATSGLTEQLITVMGDEDFAHFLTGLMTLIELKEAAEDA